MRIQPPPEFCTRCRGTRLVAILWNYIFLDGQAKEAIEAGRAYFGLSHRYFTSVDPTLVVGRFVVKQSELPAWACRDCSPEWLAVHRLADSEWRAAELKQAAIVAQDFKRPQPCFMNSANLKWHTCSGTSGN